MRTNSFFEKVKHAFYIESDIIDPSEEEDKLLIKLAGFVVKKRMSTPAIMFLESLAPLNFIGSSALTFFKPTVGAWFHPHEYNTLEKLLERRSSIKFLIQRIEEMEANAKH